MTVPASCSSCPAKWVGTAKAHCAGCHETFGGTRAFDKHRKSFKCVPPEKAGLINDDGIWRQEYNRAA